MDPQTFNTADTQFNRLAVKGATGKPVVLAVQVQPAVHPTMTWPPKFDSEPEQPLATPAQPPEVTAPGVIFRADGKVIPQPQAKPSGQWWPETHRLLGPEENVQAGDLCKHPSGVVITALEDAAICEALVAHWEEWQFARLKEPQAEQPQWPPIGTSLVSTGMIQKGDYLRNHLGQVRVAENADTIRDIETWLKADGFSEVARPIPHFAQREQWDALTPTDEPGVRVDEATGIRWGFKFRGDSEDDNDWETEETGVGPGWYGGILYAIYPLEAQQEANARIVREYEEKPEGVKLEYAFCENSQRSEWREAPSVERLDEYIAHPTSRFRIVPAQAEAQAPEPKRVPGFIEYMTAEPKPAQVDGLATHWHPLKWSGYEDIRLDDQGRMVRLWFYDHTDPSEDSRWKPLAVSERNLERFTTREIRPLTAAEVRQVWEANGRKPVVELLVADGKWYERPNPSWDSGCTYRLQPKPSASVVPWTEPGDVPVGSVIVQKASSARFLIVAASKHGIAMGQGVGWHKYADVHRDFEQLDGSACGKEVQL